MTWGHNAGGITAGDLWGYGKRRNFVNCLPECLDRDVSGLTVAVLRSYQLLSQIVMYMVITKEGIRLLAWLYFFTAGGINARKTSFFKYILYSPGTILFHRLPAVQQMIVETTQAVEEGDEAPWLKVRAGGRTAASRPSI